MITVNNVSLDFPTFDPADFSLKILAFRLHTLWRNRSRSFKAIDQLDFEIKVGERIGLYGANGSGKSTLLRLLAGIYQPTAGGITVDGSVTAILGLGAGCNPDMSADANIRMLLRIDGISPDRELVDAIWNYTEIDDEFRSMPMRAFSAGMQMRVLFSVATLIPADVLLLDEWLGVVDASFQEKAEQRMRDFTQNSRIMVLASHSLPLLKKTCTSVFYMDHGRIRDVEHLRQ